ncbi:MAG: hypothetical protein WED09_09740 [Homoserinimonas sp.]
MPGLTTLEIADVNHHTIMMVRRGAEQVAIVIKRANARATGDSGSSATS